MGVIKGLLEGPDIMGVLERVGKADFSPVAVEKKLCLNVRWKQNCSACAEACPASAIDSEKLAIDAAKCVACGVCAAVCPAGALTFLPRPRPVILSEVDLALSKSDVVRFSCDRSGGAFGKAGKVKGDIVVPCLSFLDEGLILECYARGAKEVHLAGCRPDCRFDRGKKLYVQTLRIAEALRRALVLESKAQNTKRTGKAGGPGPVPDIADRRDFIIRSGLELVKAAYAPNAQDKKEERWSWLHRLPARRADLLRMARGPAPGRHELRRYEGLQFAVISANRKRCTMCGACGALCPTGAIGTVELDEHSMLYFRSGWCTACMLCIKACPEKALSIDEKIDLGKVAESGKPLLRYASAHCPKCLNRHIPERTGEDCPVCKKQSEVPRPLRKIPKRRK
jgi:ferredoxin